MTLTYWNDYSELFEGCIAYWDGSLTSDGKLQDIIGGYHGIINGASKTAANRFGVANSNYYYNSTKSDYTQLPSVALSACPITICYWARYPSIIVYPPPDGTIIWNVFCFVYNSPDIQSGFAVGDGSTYNLVAMRKHPTISGPQVLVYSTVHVNTTDYYFVACRYNANYTMDIFVNTVKTSSSDSNASYTGFTQGNKICGKTWQSSAGWSTDLYMGELMVFHSAMSDEKIKALYELTKNKYLYPIQSGTRGVE